MKLGTVEHEGREKVVAVIDDETLLDLSAEFADMVALIGGGPALLEGIRKKLQDPDQTIPCAQVHLRAPVMPVQYRDCMVHEAHLQNAYDQVERLTGNKRTIPQVWYDQPIYYKGNRFSFIGDGENRFPL